MIADLRFRFLAAGLIVLSASSPALALVWAITSPDGSGMTQPVLEVPCDGDGPEESSADLYQFRYTGSVWESWGFMDTSDGHTIATDETGHWDCTAKPPSPPTHVVPGGQLQT